MRKDNEIKIDKTEYLYLSCISFFFTENTESSGCPFAQLGNTIDSLLNSVCGILGATFLNIEAPLLSHDEQLRPEPGFSFQEPNTIANPPDQRGKLNEISTEY